MFNFSIKILKFFCLSLILVACLKPANQTVVAISDETAQKKANQAREMGTIKIDDDLKMELWAADTLAPDPISLETDSKGRVYITRDVRGKESEFDIRGYRHWMTPSISFQTVEDRRKFLRETFAPEKSAQNGFLKDLNEDGSHDWRDLTVEKDEIWRIEDKNGDGVAETSTRVFVGPSEEITDVGGGLLVRENDAFWPSGPDMWRLTDKNKDGIYETRESISHGYAVHIGFGGHGMSNPIEGPDGKIYWQIGDIGANITDKTGKKHEYPNEGVLVRSNPDGSDFEVVVHGIRNTHEFVFDEYGNLISSDNDGDHSGESERLVHLVEGGDLGWRSNWQYGKYTDPRNNGYNVWMKEKLYVPRWEGQAAHIIPPIQNFHNGPTGMIYNPGTAMGKDWLKKFFLVEFVGTTTGSHIWSFGLKPKGASFVLDGEKKLTTGILPTGIRFGPDGALYAADWIQGWGTKNYGKIWKIDVKNADLTAQRAETKRLMELNFNKEPEANLKQYLSNADMRIRQKAQFELVNRKKGQAILLAEAQASTHQLARIHGIWGIGQLARKKIEIAASLIPLLKDNDEEIIAQSAKILGDVKYKPAGTALIPLLKSTNPRIQFFAAQALGRIEETTAVQPLLHMLKANNDEDVYLRHAAVLALSRINDQKSIEALVSNPEKSLRLAAVLVLRKWQSPFVASFLKDSDEYIATQAALAINDDLSIPNALPALAQMLSQNKFMGEPLMRRAINAALRVGGEKELDLLITYSERQDISEDLKAEALAALATWTNPSVLDRVDGRYRGENKRDKSLINSKIKSRIQPFLASTNTAVVSSAIKLLAELDITDFNAQIDEIYKNSTNNSIKASALTALAQMNYTGLPAIIESGLKHNSREVRTAAITYLDRIKVSKEELPGITNSVFKDGSVNEQQQLMKVLGQMPIDNTKVVLNELLDKLGDGSLNKNIILDLTETIEQGKDQQLIDKLNTFKAKGSATDQYAESLYGGTRNTGREIFYFNQTAQCVRCHSVNKDGNGTVGPDLHKIGTKLSREQILQSLIEPSARIAPGYGNVTVVLTDNQEVTGVLMHEDADILELKTNDAEPLKVPLSRIKSRENIPSAMPTQAGALSKREIRDLVEYLASLK